MDRESIAAPAEGKKTGEEPDGLPPGLSPLTRLQEGLASAMAELESAATRQRSAFARRRLRVVCERGIGVTEVLLRMCLRREAAAGASVVVVSHLAARQAKRRLAVLDPAGAMSAAVTTKRELDAFASRRCSGGRPDGSLGLCLVTDTFYGRLFESLAGLASGGSRGFPPPDVFRRAVFDDAWSLSIPGCRDPMAPVAWTVIGCEPVFGGATSRGFLGRALNMGSSVDGTVWCDDLRVSVGPAPAEGMFRYPGGGEPGGPVERSVEACRPSSPLDTALTMIESAADDPHGASRLAGSVRVTRPGWRGFREGGDRCCPVCLQSPEEAVEETGAAAERGVDAAVQGGREGPLPRSVLRVRTRCCGREFCAACLAKTIVSRAGRGQQPSCPHCRDALGGCLETCDPVVVGAGGRDAPASPSAKTGSPQAPLKAVSEAVSGAVDDALASLGARLLVVASPRGVSDITRSRWFERAAARWGGLERLAGNPAAVDAGLERFRLGERRIMVVRGGARKVAAVRMPWVTHILLLDCYCPSKFWARMTGASPIDTHVRRSLSATFSEPLKIKRVLPFRYFLGWARRARERASGANKAV
jgi:hypothetical protein